MDRKLQLSTCRGHHILGQSIVVITIREEEDFKRRLQESNCAAAEHERRKKMWEEKKAKVEYELSQKKFQLFLNEHPELNTELN